MEKRVKLRSVKMSPREWVRCSKRTKPRFLSVRVCSILVVSSLVNNAVFPDGLLEASLSPFLVEVGSLFEEFR